MRVTRIGILAALAGGCSGAADALDGGGSTATTQGSGSTSGASDCADEANLTSCGEGSVCLGGTCVALIPCGAAGCADSGPSYPVADTNLRECEGPGGPIPCPGVAGTRACSGTALCGQDAQYGWDRDNDASSRFAVAAGAQSVVTDTVTGLEWQGCAMGQSGTDCSASAATRTTWFEANAFCEASTWGGFDDWIVPDSYALQSISDYSTTSPAIDTNVFRNAPSTFASDNDQWWIECLWSSSEYSSDPNVVWAVMVNNGDVLPGSGVDYHPHDKGAEGWEGCYARCVRPPAAPEYERFLLAEPVPAEPVVADVRSGLVWQGCSHGQSGTDCAGDALMVDWASALGACEGLAWGGHTDWRMPNVKELRGLVDQTVASPAIDSSFFPNTPFYGLALTDNNAGQYWTGTARWYNSFALYVGFSTGASHFFVQDEGRHVRCVRTP